MTPNSRVNVTSFHRRSGNVLLGTNDSKIRFKGTRARRNGKLSRTENRKRREWIMPEEAGGFQRDLSNTGSSALGYQTRGSIPKWFAWFSTLRRVFDACATYGLKLYGRKEQKVTRCHRELTGAVTSAFDYHQLRSGSIPRITAFSIFLSFSWILARFIPAPRGYSLLPMNICADFPTKKRIK